MVDLDSLINEYRRALGEKRFLIAHQYRQKIQKKIEQLESMNLVLQSRDLEAKIRMAEETIRKQ